MSNEANQRLLTEAVLHIRKQGCPSTTPSGCSCVYQTDDGRSCAFAPAIEDYNVCLERNLASDLLTTYRKHLHPWARECDSPFATKIQRCHDGNIQSDEFVVDFEIQAQLVAVEAGLLYPYVTD